MTGIVKLALGRERKIMIKAQRAKSVVIGLIGLGFVSATAGGIYFMASYHPADPMQRDLRDRLAQERVAHCRLAGEAKACEPHAAGDN